MRLEWLRDVSDMVLRLEREREREREREQTFRCCVDDSYTKVVRIPLPSPLNKGTVVLKCRTSVFRLYVRVGIIIRWRCYNSRVQGCRFQSGPMKLTRKLDKVTRDLPRPQVEPDPWIVNWNLFRSEAWFFFIFFLLSCPSKFPSIVVCQKTTAMNLYANWPFPSFLAVLEEKLMRLIERHERNTFHSKRYSLFHDFIRTFERREGS